MKKIKFEDKKSFADVIAEGIIFGVSVTLILTIIASILIAITH